ncbi:MAG TPA: T9SS type A sorting domain-containing protein, partial [Bacteroidota bacterium]|nr:T9SS type A sorting domain-containing protein [Bacteroidota bacterium]
WNALHPQTKPLVYMTYIGVKEATSDWADALKTEMMKNPGYFQIAQIGLSMTYDGTASSHYEQDVAAGLYDKQISAFIDGLQALAMPAYVRIGYEFNGVAWNGYAPATYKQAFIRITNMMRARGVEAATVWNFAMDGVMNFQDYYPGDAYVDWWAFNVFAANHLTDPNVYRFLDSARAHGRPVLIGETTPRSVGVLDGQQSWNKWFVPFFALIHSRPEIKEFSYINWDWSQYAQWSTWGDARLEKNSVVRANFAGEMDSTQYLHASSESAFRKTLGYADAAPPATPGTISVVQNAYPLKLNWNAVTDLSGLSHYCIYKHGVLADYALTLPYADKTVVAGDTITYAVTAMDRAGNESAATPGLRVTVPSVLAKAVNGEFNNALDGWHLSSYATGAAGTIVIDSSSVLSGRNSSLTTVTQSSGTDWHLQLWQYLTVHSKYKYKISFRAKASAPKTIGVCVQQSASPYAVYFNGSHALTTTPQTFVDSVVVNTALMAKLEFFLGSSALAKVWIDSVSILEISPTVTSVDDRPTPVPAMYALHQNFPNPFNPTTTTIAYSLPMSSPVSLKIFDVMGREVATLVQGEKPAGTHTQRWNASGVSSGIYFYRLQAGLYSETRRMLILK